jgi:acyl-CoA thioester hydrolase
MRITIPEDRKLVHEMIMPIRWGDMDAYGHVNNTVYFRYMEQARCEWITSLGYEVAPGRESMLMINGFCNFNQQLSLDVYTSMALTTSPDFEAALGGATMVWVDLTTNKSAPWPEHILQKLR